MIAELDLVNQGFFHTNENSWKRINGKVETVVMIDDGFCWVSCSLGKRSAATMMIIRNKEELKDVVVDLHDRVKRSSNSEEVNSI